MKQNLSNNITKLKLELERDKNN